LLQSVYLFDFPEHYGELLHLLLQTSRAGVAAGLPVLIGRALTLRRDDAGGRVVGAA
jgi:hypothetical protein